VFPFVPVIPTMLMLEKSTYESKSFESIIPLHPFFRASSLNFSLKGERTK
jgi:hypothetical protein